MVRRTDIPSPEALFRYAVVSGVQALELQGAPRTAAVRQVAEQPHAYGDRLRRVSERTVWRWLRAWDRGGLGALEPSERPCRGTVALSAELVDFFVDQKRTDPAASVPELIRRARQVGMVHPEERIDRTTVWRALVRRGVPMTRRRGGRSPDTRRFAYRERMQLVMVDFKRFRAGPKRLRRAALYLLDDATRYGLGVRVTHDAERAEDVLAAVAETVRQYGLMSVLYWDRGPGFRADDVCAVLARLGVAAVFGTARYPEARGKIERFNRSAQARILRGLSRSDVDPSLPALQLRLRHDLFEVYNHLPHEALGGRTPHEAFHGSRRPLRPVPSEAHLQECFTVAVERTVSADHVIRFGGQSWEVPRGLRGQRITVHRRLLEGSDALYVLHEGQMVRIHRLDPYFNATSGRAEPVEPSAPPPTDAPRTASMLQFDRDHRSMLGPDGGYADPDTNPQPQEESC